MRSLIVLKGLVKSEKENWVKNEKLENYFIDINVIRKMYSIPDLIAPGKEVLSKSFGDVVYHRFLDVICTRLSKGCLVVVDPEQEAGNILEILALIFGYTVFYVIQDTPEDYVSKQKQYSIPYYPTKRKVELEREITSFNNFSTVDKIEIKHYKDVLNYWDDKMKKEQVFFMKKNDTVLHISDLHSNVDLYSKLPSFSNYTKTIFHGDYIDGPTVGGSRKLIDKIITSKNPRVLWLEGNHELRLRKYLGSLVLKGSNRKELQEYLVKTLPTDFINNTVDEFSDLTSSDARAYLEILNSKLKMFSIIITPYAKFICTHAGIRLIGQLDPRYVGNVIYGNREMNRYDRDFSELNKRNNVWSIHAHCKYSDVWKINKFNKVINLDPPSENEVVYGVQCDNNWEFTLIEN